MLMYMFHIAMALGLIALVMGLGMCKCCCKAGQCDTDCKVKCGRICGYIIVILATISLLCTMHAGYKHMTMGMFGEGMVINLDMIDVTPDDQKASKKGK